MKFSLYVTPPPLCRVAPSGGAYPIPRDWPRSTGLEFIRAPLDLAGAGWARQGFENAQQRSPAAPAAPLPTGWAPAWPGNAWEQRPGTGYGMLEQ